MQRQDLIRTAAELPPVTADARDAYRNARESMVADVNRIMKERPDVERLVGADNLAMMENNHANHARFVETILGRMDPEVLVDTVLWVFKAYRSHGFSLAYWPAQLNAWLEVMRTHLDAEHYDAVCPLYEWFIVRQPAFVALSDQQLDSSLGAKPAHE